MSGILQYGTSLLRGRSLVVAAICVLVITLMLGPIFLSLMASIKPPAEASASPPNYLPQNLSLENYQKVFDYQAGLMTYAGNSLLVAGIAIVLCLALAVPAGYGLARFQLPGKEFLFVLMLAPLMIPYQAILMPIYLNFSKIGLANSHLGLAIVHAVLQLPFSIYLMRNAFEAIPREIEEAAMMDGATSFTVLRRIFLPLVLPGMVTVTLFTFINSWNEFLAALIFMNKESAFTMPIMLVSVRSGRLGAVDWGALQSGVILSILPCILIYLLLQKYYVSGFLSGAVK
ncbi:carbohydrate ABC transporter permease [Devosia sp. J2-20]|jgi:multiple sugar transport system permease protein|uniref:sn-glycerol-3-phosphate transport system permease protein UgpE n=1 Tax=Devosia litorisediminis TaxID=2829817 RepID=A0A942E8U4_9HYPH|nr:MULTISPECIES: carbohydrate ABC transporter permease [Devosia]MBS3849512.1 carbohydrate ABC transporter permease [Devosia litorisediminis]MCZ4344473.1 carbohydrate ABC transporter permease [Devosia neptuniae]WDR00851.1 carbohydrate ABC transporter permease [Devosia sp. J2-20]|tara:strand:+ start:2395 stop:3255 length:861 start_codon:yes stop_codon:yes gene_type:complete